MTIYLQPEEIFVPSTHFEEIRQTDEEKLVAKYPEVLWLADECVMITQEGKASTVESPSIQLFGKNLLNLIELFSRLNA